MRNLPKPVAVATCNLTTLSFIWETPNNKREELLSKLLDKHDLVFIQGALGKRGLHEPAVDQWAGHRGHHALCSFIAVGDDRPRGGTVIFASKKFLLGRPSWARVLSLNTGLYEMSLCEHNDGLAPTPPTRLFKLALFAPLTDRVAKRGLSRIAL